jgi:zinc transport system ATP-binding protein
MNVQFVANHLQKQFGKQTVVKDVSFSVHKGEFIFLVGPNGGGKSTLIKMMMNIVAPSSGTVVSHVTRIGYLPQVTAKQNRHFPATVEEIVRMGVPKPSMLKKASPQEQQQIDQVMDQLGITHLKQQRIGVLSGGELQRALLARALISSPEVIILDEPTSALDPAMREAFYPMMNQLHQQGITIIIVSHDLATDTHEANRVLYIDQTLLFDGTFNAFCESKDVSPFIHTHAPHEENHHVG